MSVPVTLLGKLIRDPELRFSPKGVAYVNFTIVAASRSKKDGVWAEDDASFWKCAAFKQQAENVAESLVKGDNVIVVGRLRQDDWHKEDGTKQTGYKVTVDQVGPSLMWNCARVTRTERGVADALTPDPWAVSA